MRSSASSLRGGALRAVRRARQLRYDQIPSGVLAREPGPLARSCISAIQSGRPDARLRTNGGKALRRGLATETGPEQLVWTPGRCAPHAQGCRHRTAAGGWRSRPDGWELPRSQWSRPCAGWRLRPDATGSRGVPGTAPDMARTPRREVRLAPGWRATGGYGNTTRQPFGINLHNGCRARATAGQILATLGAATAAVLPSQAQR